MELLFRFFTSATSLVGLAVVACTIFDIGVTVLAVSSGPGPITRWVSRSAWWAFRGLHGRVGHHALLRAAGPVIVLTVVLTWLLAMITGWGLVFGQEGSLLADGETLQPAFGRIHYAASLVFGRGSPSFTPASWVWRFAEQLAALTGVAFVGVTVAYVLPVVNAVVHKRKVAATISTLGGDPSQVLARAYNGRGFGDLDLHLIALTPEVALVAQRHLAYPVVAYFHSAERQTALAPSLAVLDEVLTMLLEVVDDPAALACERSAVEPCRAAVTTFLRAVESMGIHAPDGEGLPRPDLAVLRDAGIPIRGADELSAAFDRLGRRRALLAAFLRHDGAEPTEVHADLGPEEVDDESRQ